MSKDETLALHFYRLAADQGASSILVLLLMMIMMVIIEMMIVIVIMMTMTMAMMVMMIVMMTKCIMCICIIIIKTIIIHILIVVLFIHSIPAYVHSYMYILSYLLIDHLEAQLMMARCYYEGTLIDKDDSMSFHYYQLAANQNNAMACHHLSCYHNDGIGTDKNDHLASKYHKLALKLGYREMIQRSV